MYPWISLLIVLVFTGILLCGLTLVVMARALLIPPRMTDGRAILVLKRLSPGDLELAFSDLNFAIRDEATGQPLHIAGWWIPAKNPIDRTVVIVHGYSDAKVGGIAWAPTFHTLGWNILAIDLRAHGESGGKFCTAGFWERHDLNQVLNRLKMDRPRETRTVILFGVSLGAAVVAAAVQYRDDVAAIILEGPFTDYCEAVARHSELFGAPGGWMQRTTVQLAQSLSESNFDAVRPVDLIPTVPCPVMIVHGLEDFSVTPATAETFRAALERHGDPRDVFWEVSGAGHVLCLSCDPNAYQAKLAEFLESTGANSREGEDEAPAEPSEHKRSRADGSAEASPSLSELIRKPL